MENPLINKIAGSGLITIDLAELISKEIMVPFDIAPFLYKGLILREQEYREALLNIDFGSYSGKYVAIYCSADAIIPHWAYMLAATHLQLFAKGMVVGSITDLEKLVIKKELEKRIDQYKDQRIVVKGCGDQSIDAASYADVINILQPYVKSIFYGEPCSTVPIFKKTNN